MSRKKMHMYDPRFKLLDHDDGRCIKVVNHEETFPSTDAELVSVVDLLIAKNIISVDDEVVMLA